MNERRTGLQPEEMDPAVVDEEYIQPMRSKVVGNLFNFMTGGTKGYDNIHQIIEEGLWEAYNKGFYANANVVVIENLTELEAAIKEAVLEVYSEERT